MDDMEARSLLQEQDWDAEWRALCGESAKADGASYWDTRAASFTVKDAPGEYVRDFLAHAGIAPGETVLDMGCGAGHLAIPLAQQGCHVIAADFSPRMLEALTRCALERGIPCGRFESAADEGRSRTAAGQDAQQPHPAHQEGQGEDRAECGSISTLLLSWEDDWNAHGLGEGCADVAISSRSIAVASLRDNAMKMSRVARRYCCATVSTGTSPRIDRRIFNACGIPEKGVRTHQYLMNILMNSGFNPSCAYVSSTRQSSYDTREEAREDYRRMIVRCSGEDHPELEERFARLDAWLDSMIEENPLPSKESPGALRFKEPRVSTWAFIGWEPTA